MLEADVSFLEATLVLQLPQIIALVFIRCQFRYQNSSAGLGGFLGWAFKMHMEKCNFKVTLAVMRRSASCFVVRLG